MPPLKNLRQETFCHEYLKDQNGERAYLAAGYHAKSCKDGSSSASACASTLLKHVKVKSRLRELLKRRADRMEITGDRVLREMACVGTSDIRKVLSRDGSLADPSTWDDDTAAAVSSIKIEKLFEGKGKDKTHIGYTQELKLWDKNNALTNLAKHFKLLNDEPSMAGLFAGAQVQVNMYFPAKDAHAHSNGAITNGHAD